MRTPFVLGPVLLLAACHHHTLLEPIGDGLPTVHPHWVHVPGDDEQQIEPFCMMSLQLALYEYYYLMEEVPLANCHHRGMRSRRGMPAPESTCQWSAPALTNDVVSVALAANALSQMWGLDSYYEVSDDGMSVSVVGGDGVRLPVEKEWEWAASAAGETHRWSGTDAGMDLWRYADLRPVRPGLYRAVSRGQYTPNALGLYDMSGNGLEIVWSLEDEESPDSVIVSGERLIRKSGLAFESPSHSGRLSTSQIGRRLPVHVRSAIRFVVENPNMCDASLYQ